MLCFACFATGPEGKKVRSHTEAPPVPPHQSHSCSLNITNWPLALHFMDVKRMVPGSLRELTRLRKGDMDDTGTLTSLPSIRREVTFPALRFDKKNLLSPK
jgi:hypothetical protein